MRRWAIAVCSLLLVVPASVRAQARLTGADLDGTISDQTGAIVPGCTITVINRDTNVTRLAVADDIGHYAVPALPPGTYTVSATLSGFKPQTRDAITLLLGEASTIDFTLTVADATDAVTVEAPASVLSTNRTTIASVIQQQQIQSLPINGRSFIGFALIAPGVATDRTPLQGAAATSGLSFTGQRGRSNNVTVDGLDNTDPIMGSVRAVFSQDAVREFQVLVNSYSAEFGHASAGVINIVTKSGTNTAHGGTFFFFRDKALNAKGYFDPDKPPFGQKQWGGTIGGPVRRNRTFLFTSFEQNTIRDARLVTIDPTAAALLNEDGFPVDLGIVPLAVRNTEALAKLDHQWTAARALTIRGTYADVDRDGIDDFGGIVARSRGTAQLRTDWSVSAAETDVLSSHWINELRGQFAHENQHVIALDPLCQGTCDDIDEGGPTLELTGVASVGRQRFTPQVRLYDRVQLADTVSVDRGAHHFKFGADYNHITLPGSDNWLPSHFGGRYIFAPIPPLGIASALDGLQKGMPAAYIQGYGTAHYPDERYQDLALFAQDEWKHGRLVIRPGVRYQRQFWQPATYTSSDVGGGTISFPLPSDPNNIAPRIGASFDMTGDGHTILHGSYGIFYDNIILIMESPSRLGTGGADGIRTLVLPAPAAAIAWNAPNHRLTEAEGAALAGGSIVSAVSVADPALKASFSHQVSVGVDRRLTSDLSLSVSGIYLRGFNLPGTFEFNPLLPATLGPGRRPNDVPCATNPAAPCINGGIPGSSATIIQQTAFADSWYTGLVTSLHKRFSHGVQFLLSYTLSKAEDTSTDFQSSFLVQNSGYGRNPDDPFGLPLGFDPESERGPATHDQRHRFVASGICHLPWDLSVSGIVTAASGRPYTPLAGAGLNGDGNGGQFPPDRARRNPADESTSVGRNSETTVWQMNVDLRVSRTFRVGTRGTIEAMVEAFNLVNRVNFIEDTNQSSFVIFGPGAFPTNPLPAYGRYTQTLPPRQVQVALKVGF